MLSHAQVSRSLRTLPYVEPTIPTLALVGAPNVGKSSLVRLLSSGVPEVRRGTGGTRKTNIWHNHRFCGRRLSMAPLVYVDFMCLCCQPFLSTTTGVQLPLHNTQHQAGPLLHRCSAPPGASVCCSLLVRQIALTQTCVHLLELPIFSTKDTLQVHVCLPLLPDCLLSSYLRTRVHVVGPQTNNRLWTLLASCSGQTITATKWSC